MLVVIEVLFRKWWDLFFCRWYFLYKIAAAWPKYICFRVNCLTAFKFGECVSSSLGSLFKKCLYSFGIWIGLCVHVHVHYFFVFSLLQCKCFQPEGSDHMSVLWYKVHFIVCPFYASSYLCSCGGSMCLCVSCCNIFQSVGWLTRELSTMSYRKRFRLRYPMIQFIQIDHLYFKQLLIQWHLYEQVYPVLKEVCHY